MKSWYYIGIITRQFTKIKNKSEKNNIIPMFEKLFVFS